MSALCRDCAETVPARPASERCPACASPRLIEHDELDDLTVAHIDCDAFYATIEKRDEPSLAATPVIVGGGRRGVVAACCYMARIKGVHSAMPMFKARKLCPEAIIVRPTMEKYQTVGRQVRALMQETTPLVEPISIDEAFLDLSGTRTLHGGSPAHTLVQLIRRIEDEIGVTASVGLSYNKFLAKMASDLDKPRGFAVIGQGEALDFLDARAVGDLWGVGKALRRKLRDDGLETIGQLRDYDEATLVARYGSIGRRLARFSHGEDDRSVDPRSEAKSISAETTFEEDISDRDELEVILWRLSEKVARRLRRAGLSGGAMNLKLRTSDFRIRTRSRQFANPTQLAEVIYGAGAELLAGETDGTRFRLIGIGAVKLGDGADADPLDLADPDQARKVKVAEAIEAIRDRFGDPAIAKGRGWRS